MRKDLSTVKSELDAFLESTLSESLILDHLKGLEQNPQTQQKKFLIQVKLLADYISVLKKFKDLTPNKAKAHRLLAEKERLFEQAFLHLKGKFPTSTKSSLGAQAFYSSESHLITTEERSKILMGELAIQCAIAKELASEPGAEENAEKDPLITEIFKATKDTGPSESLYSTSVTFIKKAAQHFSSFSTPLLQSLQESLVETLSKAAGKNAEFEAKDQIEANPNLISNTNIFVVEGLKSFRSRFSAGFGSLFSHDLETFNRAYHQLDQFKRGETEAADVAKALRTSIKSLSLGARYLTRAIPYLQESLCLILKPYLRANHLSEPNLSKLAGIFLELPFSNKDWGLAFAVLRKNFSKLNYEDKLKVIKAATERQIKKKDPSAIVSNLIWQAYASNSAQYANENPNNPSSLRALNAKHFAFIDNYPFLLESKRDAFLSDLPELFDYQDGAKEKQTQPLSKEAQQLKALAQEEKRCEKNCAEIQKAEDHLQECFDDYSKKYGVEVPEDVSIENRLRALEIRQKKLISKPDPFCADEIETLRRIISNAKLTLELKQKREHLNQNEGTRHFYSELLRGLSIGLGAHRQLASGIVERRNVPTVLAGTFLSQLGSLLSMPVVSGILSGIGEAIETAGSLNLKHRAEILSKVTTTNSELEHLVEKMTILLAYHLEEELEKYEPDSVKKIARFCQERLLGLMLIHGEKEDWCNLDKAAEKYVRLVTEEMTEEDSIVAKASLLFDSIKTLSVFRLKTIDPSHTRKTIAEVVTEKPFVLTKTESTKKRFKPLPKKPPKKNPSQLSGAVATPFLAADAALLSKMQRDLEILQSTVNNQKDTIIKQTEKIGQLSDRTNSLENENERLKKDVRSQTQALSELQEKTKALAKENAQLKENEQKNQAYLDRIEQRISSLDESFGQLNQQRVTLLQRELEAVQARVSPAKTSASLKQGSPSTPLARTQGSESNEEDQELETFIGAVSAKKSKRSELTRPDKTPIAPRRLDTVFSAQDLPHHTGTSANSQKNKHLLNLVRLFNELLSSELTFCASLETLSSNFTNCDEAKKNKLIAIIGETNFKHISRKIEKIRLLSENPFSDILPLDPKDFQSEKGLLTELKARISSLVNFFMDADSIRTRRALIQNLSRDFKEIINDLANDSRCSEIFNSFVNQENPSARFQDVYITPLQRPSRYCLFFTNMKETCDALKSELTEMEKTRKTLRPEEAFELKKMEETCNTFRPEFPEKDEENTKPKPLSEKILLGKRYSDAFTKLCQPNEVTSYKLSPMKATDPVVFPEVLISGEIYLQISNNTLYYAVAFNENRNLGQISLEELARESKKDVTNVSTETIKSYTSEILKIISERNHIPRNDTPKTNAVFLGGLFGRSPIGPLSQATLKDSDTTTLTWGK